MRLQFISSSLRDIELYRNYIQRFIDERCRIEDRDEVWHYMRSNPRVGAAIAKSYQMSNHARLDMMFGQMLKPKLTVIAAGIKGGGKTGFCYFAGEEAHKRMGMDVCMYNPLNYRADLLPKYFYDAYDRSEIRKNSFIIADEAALFYGSRRSMSGENVDFSHFLFTQRHTGCPLITSQQILATSDINSLRMADNFIFKQIGLMQMEKERKRRDPMFMFLDFLRPMNIDEVLFMSSDLMNIALVKAPLPTFWNEELSIPAQITSVKDAAKIAKRLYDRGMPLKKIVFRMELLGMDWDESDTMEHAGI